MIKQPALAQEQYACVYAWLALLFFREVDDEGLIQLQSAGRYRRLPGKPDRCLYAIST
ncbi:Functional role page for Chaperone protein TorD [Salmonella enterica subsp. enterica serovar Senftenberg str. A4-543]|uniref:Functional role page for Chaperone protein TorD n=1 Tax=Salmonella enterica subsp. enterica serovar Senftenberg str. A4-543 TaxID=913082 RepID=G5R2K7_SALSE|nr:Functional role page for Chaperone protein TorD [Salmonella enterica subsp. enterica serovar Senftenberg str. A4-543]